MWKARPCSEVPHAGVLGGEANRRSRCLVNGLDGVHDLTALGIVPFFLVAHRGEMSHSGGAVVLKICDAAMQFFHRSSLGVDRYSVANGLSFDTIFLFSK